MSLCAHCGASLEGSPRLCPACGKEPAVADVKHDTATSVEVVDPYLGALFAQKFRIHKLIGEGGMGRVYRATQLSLDKVICLKVLRRELASDPETKARFQREAKAASRLNHPHSIQVIDFGAGENGELYIAMELVNGVDLHQIIQKEFPIPEERIRHIMSQVLDALSEAHAQKVIHRDLKPENIMVGQGDFVKVLDFGIAQIQDGSSNKLTKVGLVCGTPEYMSPEQARGEPLDARSDLYSAGVILFQMAVGQLPFQAETAMGFVTKHLLEVPPPAHLVRPEVSLPLGELIARSLGKDKKERPESAMAMRDALLATAGPVTAAVTQAGSWRSIPRLTDPSATPRVVWVGLGAGAAVAAGLAGFLLLRPATQRKPSSAARAAAAPKSEEFRRYMESGKTAYDAQSWKDALRAYELAARADPSQPEPYKRIGLIYQMQGDHKLAAAHFQKYVDSIPTPPDAERIRALITQP